MSAGLKNLTNNLKVGVLGKVENVNNNSYYDMNFHQFPVTIIRIVIEISEYTVRQYGKCGNNYTDKYPSFIIFILLFILNSVEITYINHLQIFLNPANI